MFSNYYICHVFDQSTVNNQILTLYSYASHRISNLNGWPRTKATGGPWVSSTPQLCPWILFLTITLRLKSKATCRATESRGATLGPICKFTQTLTKTNKYSEDENFRHRWYENIYLFDDGNEVPWMLIRVPCFKPFCIGPINGMA